MNQFKDLFLGRERRDYTRATTAQKCMRVSGKHNDLDNVGPSFTPSHVLRDARQLLVRRLLQGGRHPVGVDAADRGVAAAADRLFPTIFRGDAAVPRDDEAYDIWTKLAARPTGSASSAPTTTSGRWAIPGRAAAARRSTTSAAPTSPAREEAGGGACRGRRVQLRPLRRDLEQRVHGVRPPGRRHAAAAAGAARSTPAWASSASPRSSRGRSRTTTPTCSRRCWRRSANGPATRHRGTMEPADVSMRVVADHMRAMTFLIADGVVPSNEWRGYVLRKIMRRAMRHGKRLGQAEPFLHTLVDTLVREFGDAYPELTAERDTIVRSRPQRGRALRRGADRRPAAARGRARPRGGGRRHRARRRGVQALRHLRHAARLHRGHGRGPAADARPRGLRPGDGRPAREGARRRARSRAARRRRPGGRPSPEVRQALERRRRQGVPRLRHDLR